MNAALLALTLWQGEAQAQDLTDPLLFERAQRRGRIGLAAGALGPPVIVMGVAAMVAGGFFSAEEGSSGSASLALGGFTMVGVGAAGFLAGPPVLAASSVRGAKLSGADPILGYASWGLLGAALLPFSARNAEPEDILAAATAIYVGSLVSGGLQLRRNDAAVGYGASSLRIMPTASGLALAGTF